MPRKFITTRATARLAEDPTEFVLGGALLSGGTWSEEFRVIPALSKPALVMLARATLQALDTTREAQASDLTMIDDFFGEVLYPDDLERFTRITGDREYLVDVEDLRETIEFVVEALTNRPTNGRPNSPAGPSTTASTSTAGSSSPATPRLPSLPKTGRAKTSPPSRSRSTSTASSKRSS